MAKQNHVHILRDIFSIQHHNNKCDHFELDHWRCPLSGIILDIGSTNERGHYIVTPHLIGLAHVQNDPCGPVGSYCGYKWQKWVHNMCIIYTVYNIIWPILPSSILWSPKRSMHCLVSDTSQTESLKKDQIWKRIYRQGPNFCKLEIPCRWHNFHFEKSHCKNILLISAIALEMILSVCNSWVYLTLNILMDVML